VRHRVRLLLTVAVLAVAVGATSQPARQNVILITLDGARVEEIFGGLDVAVLRSTLRGQQRVEDQSVYRRFWAETSEARRLKLLPFFWGTLMRDHGSIAGNPTRGSHVRLANRHWFSYPGYSEMLVGRAHDDVIKSNDPVRNPYPTVLEHFRTHLRLAKEQVAMFGSWSVFKAIVEHTEGSVSVNAGYEAFESPDAMVRKASELQFHTPTPWDSVRHDAYTFRFAMDHLARYRPRVLYLSLGETDDWAHDGRYDRVLESYGRTDQYLQELWQWLQSQPDYAGTTSLLITTDYGRGRTPADWRDHGEKYVGAGDTWMAFVSPGMSKRGEWTSHAPLTNSQVAATLLAWVGLDWRAIDPMMAPPIS
jgi:hypothetical protein